MDKMNNLTKFYLFNMTNGKKKLAYGKNPDDAYDILALRLSKDELDQVIKTEYVKILQQELQNIVDDLG